MAIRNCKHKGLEELYINGSSRKIAKQFYKNCLLILDHIAAISDIKDCIGVKNFHELKGSRKATYSMHVNGNYCITFKWNNQDVFDVDFEDYY